MAVKIKASAKAVDILDQSQRFHESALNLKLDGFDSWFGEKVIGTPAPGSANTALAAIAIVDDGEGDHEEDDDNSEKECPPIQETGHHSTSTSGPLEQKMTIAKSLTSNFSKATTTYAEEEKGCRETSSENMVPSTDRLRANNVGLLDNVLPSEEVEKPEANGTAKSRPRVASASRRKDKEEKKQELLSTATKNTETSSTSNSSEARTRRKRVSREELCKQHDKHESAASTTDPLSPAGRRRRTVVSSGVADQLSVTGRRRRAVAASLVGPNRIPSDPLLLTAEGHTRRPRRAFLKKEESASSSSISKSDHAPVSEHYPKMRRRASISSTSDPQQASLTAPPSAGQNHSPRPTRRSSIDSACPRNSSARDLLSKSENSGRNHSPKTRRRCTRDELSKSEHGGRRRNRHSSVTSENRATEGTRPGRLSSSGEGRRSGRRGELSKSEHSNPVRRRTPPVPPPSTTSPRPHRRCMSSPVPPPPSASPRPYRRCMSSPVPPPPSASPRPHRRCISSSVPPPPPVASPTSPVPLRRRKSPAPPPPKTNNTPTTSSLPVSPRHHEAKRGRPRVLSRDQLSLSRHSSQRGPSFLSGSHPSPLPSSQPRSSKNLTMVIGTPTRGVRKSVAASSDVGAGK
jgi:hypothetical protein